MVFVLLKKQSVFWEIWGYHHCVGILLISEVCLHVPSNHHITWPQKGKSKTKMKDTSIGELLDRQKLTPETNTILGAGATG